MEIVPAILTDKEDDLTRMLDQSACFAGLVQIDYMDGEFVPSKSLPPKVLKHLTIHIDCELHLMVQNPLEYLPERPHPRVRRVLYHLEAPVNHDETIHKFRQMGLEVGLCINPDTEMSIYEPWIPKIDSLLFMSVVPGYYGSPFVPEVLKKVEVTRKNYPRIPIGLDGGVSKENLLEIKAAGVTYACVGSRIFRTPDPEKSYQELSRIVEDKAFRSHTHRFVEEYQGLVGFGLDRDTDEKSLRVFLQKFSDDALMAALVPRMTETEINEVLDLISRLLKQHLNEEEYHRLFLK